MVSPVHEPVLNPVGCTSPSIRDDPTPTPVCSPGTPMPSKHMRKSLNLSPITPKRNDNTWKQKRKRPNGKVTGRFTRSMLAKVSTVKSSVSKSINIEIVVIDDEEENPVSLNDGLDVDHEPVVNHANNSPHVSDENLQVHPVVDPPAKDKSTEANLPGFYRIGEMVHPLFVNCLLDKIHRMEE